MERIRTVGTLFVMITISFIAPLAVADVPVPQIPVEPIYFEPPVVEASLEQKQLSCIELDNTIRTLHPYRYSYKPQFYEDKANTLATTLITVDSVPIVGGLLGLSYLAYSALVEEKESRRMLNVEQKISMLQQLKAELHCFE